MVWHERFGRFCVRGQGSRRSAWAKLRPVWAHPRHRSSNFARPTQTRLPRAGQPWARSLPVDAGCCINPHMPRGAAPRLPAPWSGAPGVAERSPLDPRAARLGARSVHPETPGRRDAHAAYLCRFAGRSPSRISEF